MKRHSQLNLYGKMILKLACKKEWFMSRIFKNLTALPAGAQGRVGQPVLSHGDHEKKQPPARFPTGPFNSSRSANQGEDPSCGFRLLQLLFLLRSRFPFKNQPLLYTPNHQQRAGLPDLCDDQSVCFRLFSVFFHM